ncbi:MAG: family 10 glycosylhydrolase [Armatimonadetes bacterium]|nr:family 10 glycosylhydrolase [Armatimonadota bacterium]
MFSLSVAHTIPHRTVSLIGAALLLAALLLPATPQVAHAQPRVAVIEGDYLGENGLPNQEKSQDACRKVVALLQRGRVPCVLTKDSEVEREGVPEAAVAILPYNRAMTDAEAAQVCRFMDGGGKLVCLFVAHDAVLERIGLRPGGLAATPEGDPFAQLVMTDGLAGAPGSVGWAPEQVALVEPAAGARPLAMWRGKSGTTTALPALLARESGAFFTADARSLNGAGGAQLLRAVIGQLCPALWPAMLPTDPAQVGPLGRFASLVQLQAYVARQVQANPLFADALAQATVATGIVADIKAAVAAGDLARALALEEQFGPAADRAFWASYPSIPGELRGVWMHNTAAPSWPVAMQHLKDANFNAVFPYMMSGGVAFYRSKVLAVHPKVRTHGDYLSEAVAAAKAAGVPIHARMLNLTTLFAPADAVTALRKAGRLMVTTKGTSSSWLCPTSPANRQAQVAAALEMAGYGVDGIHFDYLRYPWKDVCFCKRCRAKFERDCGVKVGRWPADAVDGCYRGRFADWRREQITTLVAEIAQAVRRKRPSIFVSAAVFLNWESHRESFGQDWVAWIDRGMVDFVCPMDYTPDPERFELYVTRQEKWIAGKCPWAAGLGVYADSMKYGGAHMAVEQIRVAREHGSRGFVIFNYAPALVTDYVPWLKLGVTREPTAFACPAGAVP